MPLSPLTTEGWGDESPCTNAGFKLHCLKAILAVKWKEEIPNGLKANFYDDFYWCPFQVGSEEDKV